MFPPNRLPTSAHSLKFYYHTNFYCSQISHGSVMYTSKYSPQHIFHKHPQSMLIHLDDKPTPTQWVLIQFCIIHSA